MRVYKLIGQIFVTWIKIDEKYLHENIFKIKGRIKTENFGEENALIFSKVWEKLKENLNFGAI